MAEQQEESKMVEVTVKQHFGQFSPGDTTKVDESRAAYLQENDLIEPVGSSSPENRAAFEGKRVDSALDTLTRGLPLVSYSGEFVC